MLRLFLLSFSLLFTICYGLDFDSCEFQALRDGDIVRPPPFTFEAREMTARNALAPKVDVISGEYCEEECDLVVAGAEPLSYRRFYSHKTFRGPVLGQWRANPECFMLFNFELTKAGEHRFCKGVSLGKETGAFYIYDSCIGTTFSVNWDKYKSFTNSTLSGQQHPLNTSVTYEIDRKKKGSRCTYTGTVTDGDGRVREFCSEKERWPVDKTTFADGWRAPPYTAKVHRERRPNGNILYYEYEDYNRLDSPSYGKKYYLLKSIKAYNAKEDIELGSLQVDYHRKKDFLITHIGISGSDQRKAFLSQQVRKIDTNKKYKISLFDVVLTQIRSAGKPLQNYNYKWEHRKTYFDNNFLYESSLGESLPLRTVYQGDKKVAAQYAPVGEGGMLCPIVRFQYENGYTISYDGKNSKTLFRFNDDKRITAVEKYQGESLWSTEKSEWDHNTGNLLSKKLEDSSGHILFQATLKYDENHNVTEEHISDETTEETIRRTYTKDLFNLVEKEWYPNGKRIEYSYVPQTNLPATEIVYEGEKILKRKFYFYDPDLNSVCIQTITDDGKSLDHKDIREVTYRKIEECTPKKSNPV